MPAAYADETYNLRIELDEKNCQLAADQVDAMEGSLDTLSELTRDFPVSDLHVVVAHFERSGEYHIKTSLRLPSKTLFTGEHDSVVVAAFDRCVRKLVQKVRAYKDRMETQDGDRGKLAEGTHGSVTPDYVPNLATLEQTLHADSYAGFRREMSGFDRSLRQRVGRWVQRYPEVDAMIGERLPLDDIVEEVMLTAYDRFAERPATMLLGGWLETLVDPAIRNLLRHPDEELEEVSFARTLREMDLPDTAYADDRYSGDRYDTAPR